MTAGTRSRYSLGTLGFAVVFALWWVVSETIFGESGVVPSPRSLIAQLQIDGSEYYFRQISVTVTSAGQGLLWGAGLAIVLGAVVLATPRLIAPLTQLAVFIECIPAIAVGPIVLAVAGGRTPSIFLAAMAVFFTTLLGLLLGARAVSKTELEVARVFGASKWGELRKVRIPTALPAVFVAFQIAVPAAILGVLIGEYLGGVDSGIGVALAVAQRSIQVERTWIFGLSAALITTIGYLSALAASHLALPWAHEGKKPR